MSMNARFITRTDYIREELVSIRERIAELETSLSMVVAVNPSAVGELPSLIVTLREREQRLMYEVLRRD